MNRFPANESPPWDNPLREAMHAHADGDLTLALEKYREILSHYPHLSRVAYNLGNILKETGEYNEAEAFFRQALNFEPQLFEAAQNLAFVIQEQGRIGEAIEQYQNILERWPGLPDPQFSLACLQLLTGNLSDGWRGYESRFDCLANPVPRRHLDIPLWNGNLSQKLCLLVHTEQGYGDTLQMCRYLPLLAEVGMRIILETDAALAPLLARMPQLDTCLVRGEQLPPVDAQIPLMSLPHIFTTSLATIPHPRLPTPDLQQADQMASLLPDNRVFRIGLCWSGRMDLPVNRKRSCPPEELQRLLDVPDCFFVSLQTATGPEHALSDHRLFDRTDLLQNFHDTAALIASLDLVITIDTSVAHLAGSMGKPTWLLLPFVPDWRWLLDRDDSPWYPSMRLFRQSRPAQWGHVIDKVLLELARQSPSPAEALTNRGALLGGQGRHDEALHCYCEALQHQTNIAITHYNMGNSLSAQGHIDEARASWQQALAVDPNLVEAWHNLAISYRDQGDIAKAHQLLQHALQLRPEEPELHHTLGELFQVETQLEPAIAAFRQSLALRPDSARSWNSLGTVYQSLEQDDAAAECYRHALSCDPDHLHARNNLGAVLLSLGKPSESVKELEQLLERDPQYHDGHWNLACSLLANGEWTRGWAEFEYRFLKHSPVEEGHCHIPRWDGSPLAGKTILLVGEQAFGDTIQFVRFIPLLASMGAEVVLECQAQPLIPLVAGVNGISRVICRGEPLPPVDCRLPLMSLPFLLNIAPDAVGASVPYIKPDLSRHDHWMGLLAEDNGVRVGLCWWGRQTLRNRRRSCPPDLLLPLTHVPGITLYRLQVGDEAPLPPFSLIDHTEQIHDFADTAALISCLDLVITIDTAVAHLAGALGKPVWLMLPTTGDWRWMTNREASPWYPGMRIFRQTDQNGWQPVIQRIASQLQHFLASTESTECLLMTAGDTLREQEQWQEAYDCYCRVLELDPSNILANLRAGGCLIFLNRHHEAQEYLQRAIALQPDAPDPHINLAICYFADGDWQHGWQEFEWRKRYIAEEMPPIPALPRLTAGERLDGRSILVHCEQGFGDMLQFCRYLSLLTQLGATVSFSVPKELVRLFHSLGDQITIIPHGKLLPATDFQTLLMSLPGILYAIQPTPLIKTAYLQPPRECLAAWKKVSDSLQGIKIGLAWQGRNLGKSGYRRSLDLMTLTPLLELEGCSFVSLHPQPMIQPHPKILDYSAHISDFADTAALMLNLDLVITVDTAVAHLAGALGVTCWTALLHAPDWRWFPLESSASSWYPSLRLFRQDSPGDWNAVVQRLFLSLQEELLTRKGHRLMAEGREAEAIDCFRTATEHRDASAAAWLNLGNALHGSGETDAGRAAVQQAVAIDASYPEAWQNLGLLHQAMGEISDAYLCFQKALRLRPDYPTARWNLSLLQLLLGDYQIGFCNYESRFDKTPPIPRLHQDLPRWEGTPLTGKRLLVHAEQGYGDTIQFCRYLPILETMGAEIIFEVQDQRLKCLMESLPCSATIIVRGELAPPADLQTPLLSIPKLLETTVDTIPATTPYLSAGEDKIKLWQQHMASDARLHIGLTWQGSHTHTNDRFRSCPPELLEPFAQLSHIAWYLLQPDIPEDAMPPLPLINLTDTIRDFSDTAALIANLDLLVTVDTAVAHLAGALGKPVWLLLPYAPDWRWGLAQETTPWYPAMRIFRQQIPGDWPGVLQMIANALMLLTMPAPDRNSTEPQC